MRKTLPFIIVLLCASFTFSEEFSKTYSDPTTGMEFVLVDGGSFFMGDLQGNNQWAKPVHQVLIQPFYIGKFEVTFNQYDQFCEATGVTKPHDEGWGRENRPVINVSWDDAMKFTEWLSNHSEKKFRLPSEAEWEYAYRGGTKTVYWWGDQWADNMGNCNQCPPEPGKTGTTPVGLFPANPFGIYGMGGNAYEWCLDYENDNYLGAPDDGSAWTTGPYPNKRITRGGSWKYAATELRSADRCGENRSFKAHDHGFRVVMEP